MRAAFAIALALVACSASAQQSNPLRVGSMLPSAARDVTITSVKDEGGGQFVMVEQTGQLPNAQGCEKAPSGTAR